MRYRDPVFRPPSEAESYILQITYGCSHNRCSFCGMYRTKKFCLREEREIFEDIEMASRRFPTCRRVFLADGDAMILKTEKLLRILDRLQEFFPRLERVGIYGDARGVLSKSSEELQQLAKNRLGIVYFGLESGSEDILRQVNKGTTAQDMTEAVNKVEAAGMDASVIVLLGLGGRAGSAQHVEETAKVVSRMSPRFLSALTLTVLPETELGEAVEKGAFEVLSPEESLNELHGLLIKINPLKTITFRTNHASNYVPLKGDLPQDRERSVRVLEQALKTHSLRPEWMRGL